jgi:hypothetical protein
MNDDVSLPANPPPAPAGRDDTVLDWARREGAADLLVHGLDAFLQRRRRRRRIVLGSAGGVALLIALALRIPFEPATVSVIAHRNANVHAPAAAAAIASATIVRPEQRTLPDGSTVELNADAEMTRASERAKRKTSRRLRPRRWPRSRQAGALSLKEARRLSPGSRRTSRKFRPRTCRRGWRGACRD